MKDVVFVTGNQKKADYLNKLLGFDVKHEKIELDEIQSVDIIEVAKDKAIRAFNIAGKAVLIEDVGLEFNELGGLPGPFIKYFVQSKDGLEMCCRMLDGFPSRAAVARCVFVYYDGSDITVLEGSLTGTIANHPVGEDGWDWDYIFCPDGFDGRSRAELNAKEDLKTYLSIKPIEKLRAFLEKQ